MIRLRMNDDELMVISTINNNVADDGDGER